jgi:hypothetical protein
LAKKAPTKVELAAAVAEHRKAQAVDRQRRSEAWLARVMAAPRSAAAASRSISTVRVSSGFSSITMAGNALLNSESSDERATAAQALGRSCAAEAIAPLIQALENDPECYIRAMCAGFLGSLRGANCKAALIKALSDSSADVRRRAVTGLARYDQAECYTAIEQAANDPDEKVRFQVDRALKARTNSEASGCPYVSPRGFCDPPGVGQLEDCSWVVHNRGPYCGCAVYNLLGNRTRPV